MYILGDEELDRLVREDVPYADLTTHGLGIGAVPGRLTLIGRQPMTVCGTEESARILARAGCVPEILKASGEAAGPGDRLLTATGNAAALHRVAKVAQTLVEAVSGIATRARRMVDAAQVGRPGTVVACTRKHFPGNKALALKAIMAGGAVPHRLGLSDSVLVFAEHRAFLPAGQPLSEAFARLKALYPERRLVAEAEDHDGALAIADAGADVVQVDKMDPAAVAALARAFAARTLRPCLAAAGGINEGNARDYAAAGADVLVTSSPYYAPPADVKCAIGPL